MNATVRILSALCLGVVAAAGQATVFNRLYIADMSDFGKKLGFFVDLENEAPNGQSCQIGTLKAILGVADGRNWKFISPNVHFSMGQTIHVQATISTTGASIAVDGVSVQTASGFKPGLPTLTGGEVVSWANGAADYRLIEQSLSGSVGTTKYSFSFPTASYSPVLSLFEGPLPVERKINVSAGLTVRIDATVQIAPLVDAGPYKPLVDAYEQARASKFPGKIHSDAELAEAFKADDVQLARWQPRSDVDRFGGELNVAWAKTLAKTGFYRTAKRNGYWWLVSPLGNPLFYKGVCTGPALQWDSTPVSGREDMFAQLPPRSGITPSPWSHNVWGSDEADYATIHDLNLIKRFGVANYDVKGRNECRQRLASWGFSGLGKWSQELPNTPILPVISCPSVPKIDRHIDVFDPAIRAKFRAELAAQLGPNLNSPYILGWTYGSEFDEIVTSDEIVHILAALRASPAKMAFIAYAKSKLHGGSDRDIRVAWGVISPEPLEGQALKPTAADLEALRRYYATKYYATVYDTFKSVDPHHLYFGNWIVPGWWVSDEDWNLIAPHVDVVGFDRYSDWPGMENLLGRFDKPVLLGEFSFPSWYGGARGFGRYSVYTESDAESGRRYTALLAAASTCPQCVGAMWFQYRDEPLTGRGPVADKSVAQGEHYAFGLIDACDLPKYDLVGPARAANLRANMDRLKRTR